MAQFVCKAALCDQNMLRIERQSLKNIARQYRRQYQRFKLNITKLMDSKRKISALWSKKTSEGKEFFTEVIGGLRGDIQIVVLKTIKR